MIVYWPGYHYIEIALFFEVVIILSAMCLSVFLHFLYARRKRRDLRIAGELNRIFTQIVTRQIAYGRELFLIKGVKLPHIVRAIKQMNDKVQGKEWKNLKSSIAREILSPMLPRYLHARKWIKRAYALQTLEMIRDEVSEELLLPFLKDPIPIIRISAVAAAIDIKSKRAINAVIDTMVYEDSFARYPYRDELLNADGDVYQILAERFSEEKDPNVRACCLEILSQKVGFVNLEMLADDLKSENMNLRWWAYRALENYPSKESVELLLKACDDPAWQIQALAARCLGLFGHVIAVPVLEKKLSDDQWLVRLNAALALRLIGQKGVLVLEGIKKGENQIAAETADYALSLPEIPLGNENVKWLDMYPIKK